MPTGLVQYYFPKPGDEFPGIFQASTVAEPESEERLVSELLLTRHGTILSGATSTESTMGKTSSTHGSASPSLIMSGPWFPPDSWCRRDSFHQMGPIIDPDLSPSTATSDKKIPEAVGDAEDDAAQPNRANEPNSAVPSAAATITPSSRTLSGFLRPGPGQRVSDLIDSDLIADTPGSSVDSDSSYDIEAEDDEQSLLGLPPDLTFTDETEEMPDNQIPPSLFLQHLGKFPPYQNPGKQLWCEICALKNHTTTFAMDNINQWIEHHMIHLDFKPPSLSVCWFCDNVVFRSGDSNQNDPTRSFYDRMEHIWRHITEENFGVSDMRPDFHMVKHLKEIGLISEDEFEKSSQYSELPMHLRIPGSANPGESSAGVPSRTQFRVMNDSK